MDAELGVEEGGFESDKAGLAPLDGGELVDERLFGVGVDFERGAEFGDVLFEDGFVFDAEDDVDDGGEPMFEGIRAGFDLPLGGGGSFRFGAVDAGLFGVRAFFGHWNLLMGTMLEDGLVRLTVLSWQVVDFKGKINFGFWNWESLGGGNSSQRRKGAKNRRFRKEGLWGAGIVSWEGRLRKRSETQRLAENIVAA